MEPEFTIAEASERTGLSQDTIRYYEKISLLPPSKRNRGGKRVYTQLDVDRMIFITHLKRTHMPLKVIQDYMKYSSEKNDEACRGILEAHKLVVEAQAAELNATLGILHYKLNHFQQIKTGKRIIPNN